MLEGNRRITALKLVNEPNLVPKQYSKLKKEFQKLNAIANNSIFENIPCVATRERDLANEWIRLKHTGENAGAGTVNWNSHQTGRFNMQTSGKVDARIIFLDELKELEGIPLKYKERLFGIKKTNFDRLMSDPDIRQLLGVNNNSGRFTLTDGVNPYFLMVLSDLVYDNLSVGKIYNKDDRLKYINEIKERVNKLEPYKNLDNNDVNVVARNEHMSGPKDERKLPPTSRDSTNDKTDELPDSTLLIHGKRDGSYPVNRKTLVPAHHKLTITHPRILKIFNELKALDINIYPNAGAVLFRVFIELSADCYFTKHSLPDVSVDSILSKKLEAIISDFKSKSIMTVHELRAARQMSSSQTQNNSVKTFHSYVHNKDITPSATDLKSAWDDLWTFIENIWR